MHFHLEANVPKGQKQPFELQVGEIVSGTVVEVYAATRNSDTTEGRGSTVDNSYHLTLTDARIATKGIDVMGSDGKVASRVALRLDDGRYFLVPVPIEISQDPEAKARLRESALAKLSPAERAALLDDR